VHLVCNSLFRYLRLIIYSFAIESFSWGLIPINWGRAPTDVEVSYVLALIILVVQTYSTCAQWMSLSLLINFSAFMLRIDTPRRFALTSTSQFDQSYVNLFTCSFINCYLFVEHYCFPQFVSMITMTSYCPFEHWISRVVAQLLSSGRQIKTVTYAKMFSIPFVKRKQTYNYFFEVTKQYCETNWYHNLLSPIVVLIFTFSTKILFLRGLFPVMINVRLFLSSAFSTKIFCLDVFCSHLCCLDCLYSFRTVCFFCGYTIDQCADFAFMLLGLNFLSAPYICESRYYL
jgi:hypothetical protein